MKITRSLRDHYAAQKELNERLRLKVDGIFKPAIEDRWHYESRVKSDESYALKVETGRFSADALEDFFACTIVVENIDAIDRALKLVKKHCNIINRRPSSDKFTHKPPESFPFDDLRLYVKLKANPILPPNSVNDVLFELQIRTFLQHAWVIATHDLVYKTSDISWAQQRIAYQTKALLESAETAISRSADLAKAPGMEKEDKITKTLLKTTELLKRHWDKDSLPADITRLAKTLSELCNATTLNLTEIEDALERETAAGRGRHLTNLPPYLIIVQSLLSTKEPKLIGYLTHVATDARFKLLLTQEVDIPSDYPQMIRERVREVPA